MKTRLLDDVLYFNKMKRVLTMSFYINYDPDKSDEVRFRVDMKDIDIINTSILNDGSEVEVDVEWSSRYVKIINFQEEVISIDRRKETFLIKEIVSKDLLGFIPIKDYLLGDNDPTFFSITLQALIKQKEEHYRVEG